MNKLQKNMLLEVSRLEESIAIKESMVAKGPEGILHSYYDRNKNRYRRFFISYQPGTTDKKKLTETQEFVLIYTSLI